MRLRGQAARRWLALVVGPFLEFLPELVQNFGFLSTAQLLLELFKSNGDDVIVMCSSKAWIGRYLEPKMVKEIEILISQSRRMRAEIIFPRHPIRQADFHNQPRLGFRQSLPGIAGQLGLFVSA